MVRGVVGESVTLECQYDQKYKDYVKKWCRRDPDVGCKDLVPTEKPQNGRISITDNKTQGIFSVTMDNLKNSDEGLYQCMIQKANENFTISLEFPEGLTGPEKVRGVVGQSVTVECQYEHEYRDNVKKWCKKWFFLCDALVSTEEPQQGRVSITDKKTQGIFSVTMNNLMKSDEGWYQCTIVRAFYKPNKRFTISLEVSEAPEKEATTLEISTEIMWTTSPRNWMSTKKAESTETSVSSHPMRNTERKIHYVWALTRWILFGVLVLSTISTSCMTAFPRQADEKVHEKQNLRQIQISTNMELLQGELTHQKQPRIVESIVLLFLISVGFTSGSTALTGPEMVRGEVGESVTLECQYDQKYKDYVKKWCRRDPDVGCKDLVPTEKPQNGRISITDNKALGIFSVTMDNLKNSDEGLYQCMIQKANENFTISLEFPEGLTGPEKVRGVVGQSVTVECQYEHKYRDNVKKWCKKWFFLCDALVSTEEPQQGRVSITDKKTQGIFSVTMNNLMKSDEGWYQCMIQRAFYKPSKRFTISLEVSEAPEKEATTLEISTEIMWTTSPRNWMSTKKAESTETSVSSHPIRPKALSQSHLILTVALSVLFLLFIAAVIVCAKLRQKMKTGTHGQRINGAENLAGNVTEMPVVYASVKHRRDNVESTYMNLTVQDAPRNARTQHASETVVYSAVAQQ
ncbi:polymeric immunoglobulin receptor-like [Hypanus sabinus]|uniref:polymeric immunoglobulin receptor-like n=1 Tax=Hypanus sabinus TaxID=79690 RepID=UPI0028C3F29C|nr:polymeric immunoglobulin receptor-like [Hypanus sabinus]